VATIDGVIVFPGDLRPPPGATVRFRIEDTTYLDLPAVVVATANRSIARDDVRELPFAIEVTDDVDPARHSLRVHVDRNGSGEIEVGDWVSVARHRVGRRLRIPVEAVE
jgi:hypothetical protein